MAASLTLNTVSGDNKINATEAKTPVTLNGSSTGLVQGTVVDITLDLSPTVVAHGTVQANGSWTTLLDASVLADGSHTISGSAPGVGTSALQTIKVDTVSPTMTAFTMLDPAVTNAQTVHYEVDFSEAVTGVTASSFAFETVGLSGASITGVSTTDNIHYTVTIDTGTHDGFISISLGGTGIVDNAGNPLAGQSFEPGVVVNDVSAVRQVAVGDVNNDGLPDIVGAYVNGGIRAIAWIKQTDGSFGTQTPLGQVTQTAITLRLADLNGDGKLDLLANFVEGGELQALLGNGDGTFRAASADIHVGFGQFVIFTVADVNHDGKPDVVGLKDSNTVGILPGNGDGTFGTGYSVAVASGSGGLAVGDLNGDGRPDIVTVQFSGSASVEFGNGDGTFGTSASYGVSGGLSTAGSGEERVSGKVVLGDLNGDGKSDIVVVGQNAVTILLNNGDGTFPTTGGTAYAVGGSPVTAALADVNGDGKLDLVVETASRSVSVLLSNGDGTFQPQVSYSTAPSDDDGNMIVVDMNGDGKPDIVLGNQDPNFNSAGEVVLYNGPPNFSGPVYTIGRSLSSVPDLADASDTGRSHTDNDTANTTLTFTGTSDPGVTILLHDSDGTTVIGTGVADNTTGAWSITTTGPLSEGAHTITAQAIGLTGVNGPASAGLVVTIDTSPPDTSTPVLDPASDTGSSNSDDLTADNTPTFTGFTEPGSSVILYDTDGTTIIGTGLADAVTGRWSITSSALADGPHTVSAQATDLAGNIGLPSPGLTVSIDTTAGTPTAVLHDQRDIAGTTYSTSGVVTATPQDSSDTISYSIDGTTFTSLPAVFAQDGSQDGIETVYVRETEVLSGATSTVPVTFKLDTAGPGITIKAVDPSPTNAATVHFEVTFSEPVLNVGQSLFSLSGSAAAGASVTGFAAVGGNSDDYLITVATGPDNGTLNLTFDGSGVTDVVGHHLLPAAAMTQSSLSVTGVHFSGAASAAGDLNGDGKPDLIVAYSDAFAVYLNNGDGTFASETDVAGDILSAPIVADMNGDGHNDLIAAVGGNGFRIFFGNGDGTFGSQQMLHTPGDGGAQAFAVADFNGDGILDVFTQTTGQDVIYLMDGHGGFNSDFSVHVGTALSPNDVNRDGRMDLVYLSGSSVVVRIGNGDGTFGNEVASDVGATPAAKAVGDVNGDRILDVVTSNSDGTVTVMLGAGNGTFTPAETYHVGSGAGSIALTDLNGDGKVDIAVADPTAGVTYLLTGNADGTFAAPVTLDLGGPSSILTITDFNGDGGADIATKSNQGLNVYVLESTPGPIDSNPGYKMEVAPPAFGFDTVAGDDIVNLAEASAGFTISGTTGADDGRTVTIDINDASNHTVYSYTSPVASGVWSVTVPSTDALADGDYTIVATVSDAVGNIAHATHALTVHETITASNVVDHDLVEANTLYPGTLTATATISIASDTTFDTTALVLDGWSDDGSGHWKNFLDTHVTLDTAAHTLTYKITSSDFNNLSSSDHPTFTFTLPVIDTAGNTTATAVIFTVDGVDDRPSLFTVAKNPTFTEGGAEAQPFSGLAASTIENQAYTSLTLTVSNVVDGANEQFFIDGSAVALTNGNSIVTHDNGLSVHVGLSGTTATVSFTGASLDFLGLVALVDGLGYSDMGAAPTPGNRVVTITEVADSGSNVPPNVNTTALNIPSTVTVKAVESVPVLTGLADTPAFTEKGSPVLLDVNLDAAVSDTDLDASTHHYAGASLTIQRDGDPDPDDVFAATGSLDLAHHNGLGENVSLDGGTTFIGTYLNPGSGAITFTFNANATAVDVDGVMQQIVYSNASDNPSTSVPIDFIFNDGNGQPSGQAQGTGSGVTTATVDVHVTQVDDAPLLSNVAPLAIYSAGSFGVGLSPTLAVFDVDAVAPSTLTGIASATMSISHGLLAGDQLFVNLPTSGGFFIVDDGAGPVVTNIDIVSNAGGVLTLSGTDTTQHYQDVLDAVSYRSTATDPTAGGTDANRTIDWQVSDGLLSSATPGTGVSETLLHIETAPKLDLDASAPGTGFTTSFTENGAPLAIVDTDVAVTTGFADLEGAAIVLTNARAGDSLSIAGTLPGGIASTIDNSVPGQITVHLDHAASVADYQTALEQFRFVNTSDNPDTTDRDITVQVSGADADSNVAHATVHVVAVNDPPVNTTPASLDGVINAQTAFAGLSVADPDAASLTTQLHVDHGTLKIGTLAGGAEVSGSGTATVTLTGSAAQIDASLHATNNVLYQSNFVFAGTDHLTITTSDGGSSGTGGPMSDVDIVPVNVSAPAMGGGAGPATVVGSPGVTSPAATFAGDGSAFSHVDLLHGFHLIV